MPAPASSVFNPLDPAPLAILVGRETELNWEARDRLIDAITRYCTETQPTLQYASSNSFGSLADLRASQASLSNQNNSNNANDPRNLLSSLLKINYEDILVILHTPRTQLSIRVCNFIAAFASFLGPVLFDAFAENSLHHLLKLSGTTKKIIATAAINAAKSISALMLPQRAIPVLLSAGAEKNAAVRKAAMECLKVLVDRAAAAGSVDEVSLQRLWDGVAEKLFGKLVGDANAEIRTLSVSIFCQFRGHLTSAQQFVEKLDPATRKQLNLALAKQTTAATSKATPSSSLKSFLAQKQNTSSSLQSTPGRDDHADSLVESKESSMTASPASPTKLKFPFPSSPLRSHSAEQLSPTKNQFMPSGLVHFSQDSVSSEAPEMNAQSSSHFVAHSDQLPRTPHRKSPIKHAKSADSFFSNQSSPSASKSKRPTLNTELTGSPMKIDSVGNESVYLDAIDSSDDEIILNVKNIVKLFDSKSAQNSPKFREPLDVIPDSSSSISHFTSLLPSSQDTLARIEDADIDELTVELPKKIFFHRSVDDAQPQPIPATPPAQRVANLGLAASTPLRRLYRAGSAPSPSASNHPFLEKTTEPLLNDLCAEFCHSGDQSCLLKILSISSKAEHVHLSTLPDNLVCSVLQIAHKNGFIDTGRDFIAVLLDKQALSVLSHSCPVVIEVLEASNAADLAVKLASSALNPLMSAAVVQLCCQRVGEFRLQLLARCIEFAVADVDSLLQASLPPLLLSLNHPNAHIRRLAVNCFQVTASKIGAESVLEAVSGSGIGDVPKRILSTFLTQK